MQFDASLLVYDVILAIKAQVKELSEENTGMCDPAGFSDCDGDSPLFYNFHLFRGLFSLQLSTSSSFLGQITTRTDCG